MNEYNCDYCDEKFLAYPSRFKNKKHKFCSRECSANFIRRSNNVNCAMCGKGAHIKPHRMNRIKHGFTCSKRCFRERQKTQMLGSGNHQYGMSGSLNSSFINGLTFNNHGYAMIYVPGHPRLNKSGRIRYHRYLVETSDLFEDKYFDIVDNVRILKSQYIVHHINRMRSDNRVGNLEIMTPSEHVKLHNGQRELTRDIISGRITGVIKLRELRETPDEDNPQPSQLSNEMKGSETSCDPDRTCEGNNSTTSAGQPN